MADEFVDFYEVLELPLDAERSDVRKRINELYVEAQKNLDHRNFDTRVRNQQLFEITLPQARYILLDAGRRDDYDRLVQSSRASAGSAPAAAPAPAKSKGARFKLDQSAISGATPSIDALPDVAPDPETVAREREEMWNKWKSGLQSAMERETAREKIKPADTAATPLADRIEAAQSGAPQPQSGAESARIAPDSSAPKIDATASAPKSRPERPKVKFDFGGEEKKEDAPQPGENAPASGAEASADAAKGRLTPEQIQERRDNHRREITREELENTGVKGLLTGAGIVFLPGVIFMTVFMSTYYPPNEESSLAIKSAGITWILWILVLLGLGYASGYFLSKSLRRKQATRLAMLSYEELLRHTNKNV